MRNLFYILFVGSLILSACNSNGNVQLVNDKAALPAAFQFDTLGLKVMASFINKKSGTMSTLYANPLALNNAIRGDKDHRAGEVFALVTWSQQADDHWFGAKIPGDLQCIELVKTTNGAKGNSISYNRYIGKSIIADKDTLNRQDRIKYIFDQQPSVMP
jgi:hypothetical protein